VLGILALLLSWTLFGGIVFGIVAIVLGLIGRGRAKRGEATNGGMALTGVILGALGLLIAIGIIVFAAVFATSDSGKSLIKCVNAAGGDQAKIQACQSEFAK